MWLDAMDPELIQSLIVRCNVFTVAAWKARGEHIAFHRTRTVQQNDAHAMTTPESSGAAVEGRILMSR